jgi:UDP-3-O-[3-hydroxymyristoyl] glucosamine N-acyltransferase
VVDQYGFHAAPFTPGIHPSAVLADSVQCDRARISVAANAVIEAGAQLADGVEIGAGCFVGRNVRIGAGSKLYANSTVHEGCVLGARVILHSAVVIGADGFGYEFKGGRHNKVRQSGIVQLDDDVEIGAGSTVDRARFGRTWIGEGTKIDNLVQIAHNVVVGKHCVIVAQSGIAGSAQVGDYVVIAAQCGVAGHVSVGSQCTLGGRAGVTKDIPAGRESYLGFPAAPAMEERRRMAAVRRLPRLMERVRKLEGKNGSAP